MIESIETQRDGIWYDLAQTEAQLIRQKEEKESQQNSQKAVPIPSTVVSELKKQKLQFGKYMTKGG